MMSPMMPCVFPTSEKRLTRHDLAQPHVLIVYWSWGHCDRNRFRNWRTGTKQVLGLNTVHDGFNCIPAVDDHPSSGLSGDFILLGAGDRVDNRLMTYGRCSNTFSHEPQGPDLSHSRTKSPHLSVSIQERNKIRQE